MAAERTLIKGAFVVSVDPKVGNVANCDILIDGEKIAEVRPGIEAPDASLIDARSMIASPGLVDAHHHLWQGPLRSVTTDWSLHEYANGIRMFAASFFRPDDMYAATLHGALEKLNAGVTTVADYCHNINTPEHASETLRALRDSGARIRWGFGFNRPPLEAPYFATMAERAEYLRDLARREFPGNVGRVTLAVCPEESIFWNSEDYVVPQFEVAREIGAHIFLHANSARDLITQEYARDARRLSKLGLLGPDVCLVHMGVTEPEEWQLVADSGAHLAFTPETEWQMAMGWPSIARAREFDIAFGLGVDITSNNSTDIRFPLRAMLQLERYRMNEHRAGHNIEGVPISSAEALSWGTLGGATALGLEREIGSITPGKRADIVLHDGNHIGLVGWSRANPEGVLIAQAGTESVDTVLVDGHVVKERGKLCGMVEQACRLLDESSDYLHRQVLQHGGFDAALGASSNKLEAQKAGGG
ncbi:MAG: amidohydrolase family protein [Phaeobacter gallaeciensis]